MSGPLDGRRVGITRPDAGEVGERLAALGATVVHIPLIEITEPLDGGVQLRGALARLAAFDWLVVTSPNGASRVGPDVASHPTLRLAAVGPATAAALEAAAGRPVDLVPAAARAEGLLAEFPRQPARVLLAQADRARTALADGLAAMGHAVESVVAYRTTVRRPSAAEATALAGLDAVVLASGSAATGWAAAVGTAADVVVVAIGPVTAGEAVAHDVAVTAVASSPDAATVADAVLRALAGAP